MPWKVETLDNSSIVEISYLGWVTRQDLYDALAAAVRLAVENRARRFLANCSEMQGGHSVFDLFELISSYDTLGFDTTGFKEAVLTAHSPAGAADVRFYETTAINRGYTVRVFSDRELALAWLAA